MELEAEARFSYVVPRREWIYFGRATFGAAE